MEESAAVNPGWRKSTYSNGGQSNCVEVGAIPWRKSSYSSNGGAQCVEVGAVPWRKSTHSNGNGGQCVEVGAVPWRKSTYSNGGEANCVEAGPVPGAIVIRDTKDNGAGPVLRATPADWCRFTTSIRATAPSS